MKNQSLLNEIENYYSTNGSSITDSVAIDFGRQLSMSTLNNWGRHFEYNGNPYWPFEHNYHAKSVDDFREIQHELPNGCLCLIEDTEVPTGLVLDNCFHIRAMVYHDFYIQIFVYIKDDKVDIISPAKKPRDRKVRNFDISIMCTDTNPYRHEVIDCVQYYNHIIKTHGLDAEIYLAYFGDRAPAEIDGLCNIEYFPLEDFSVPYGRNRSIEMCRADHVFSIDIDKFFSIEAFKDIIHYYTSLPNHGLLSIRKTKLDPASLFFNREVIMSAGLLCEEFTGMYCDDDEFLIHLSRKGILPVVAHTNYYWTHNEQAIDMVKYHHNQRVLREILLNGRKEYNP